MDINRPESGMENPRVGEEVVLVGPAGLAEVVPMWPVRGCCGITVTEIELSEQGVVAALSGVWRASFGPAAAHPGDVVLELLPPGSHPRRSAPQADETQPASLRVGERAGIRLLVAAQDPASQMTSVRSDRVPDRVSGRVSGASSARWRGRMSSGGGGARWLWLGDWPCVGTQWPYLVGPLVFIAWQQERRTAQTAPRRP